MSHDFEDAAALARRVAVLEAGRIVQDRARPGTWSPGPGDAFVASLTGANLLRGDGARPTAPGSPR